MIAPGRATELASLSAPAGKTRPRWKPAEGSRRRHIFEKALALMQRNGFHGTSIQDVADELKFTKAAFYFHVESKEQMLYEISLQTLNLMLERMTAISQSTESPEQKIRDIIDCYVKLMVDQPALFIVYFREKGFLSKKHRSRVNQLERNILRILEKIYEEGVRRHQFTDIDPAVAILGILGMCFWVYNWYQKRGRLSASEISKSFQALALSGVLTRTARHSEASLREREKLSSRKRKRRAPRV